MKNIGSGGLSLRSGATGGGLIFHTIKFSDSSRIIRQLEITVENMPRCSTVAEYQVNRSFCYDFQ